MKPERPEHPTGCCLYSDSVQFPLKTVAINLRPSGPDAEQVGFPDGPLSSCSGPIWAVARGSQRLHPAHPAAL